MVSHDKSPQWYLQSELVMIPTAQEKALAGHQHPSRVSQEEQFLTVPGVVGHRCLNIHNLENSWRRTRRRPENLKAVTKTKILLHSLLNKCADVSNFT